MRNLPNIDKAGFRRGEYVGYADGIWRITKTGGKLFKWRATKLEQTLLGETLTQISEKLSGIPAGRDSDPDL